MTEASIARINAAIKSCLIACYESDLPLARLKQFLDGLYADPRFNEKEVLIVGERVRTMLSMMFRRSDGGPLLPLVPTDPEHQARDPASSPPAEKSQDEAFKKPVEKSLLLSADNPKLPTTEESALI